MKKSAIKFLIPVIALSIIFYKFMPIAYASNDTNKTLTPIIENDSSKYTGKGVKIAIIDSGIDINHPDLKDKIIGGYDFVENKPIYKDGDSRTGHGTHVAGIAAANGKMQGVAKDALLLIYRAIGNSNSDSNIISAINKAVSDGADVINISSKTYIDAPNSDVEKAVKQAVENGVVVVKSNGNYGPNLWTTSDLAGSPYVLSVGNSTGLINEPTIKGKDSELKLNLLQGSSEFKPIENMSYLGDISSENVETKDLNNKILIAKFKNQNLLDLGKKLKTQGAAGLILTGNSDNEFFSQAIYEPTESVPIAYVTGNSAKKLDSIIKDGKISIYNSPSEKLYYQSSRGPAKGNWILKPDIVAPGTKILSTVPKEINESGYAYNTGTSMAAPYITGSVALIKEAHPDWTPEQIKSAICNNPSILKDSEGNAYPVLGQGSGSINIDKAINTDSFIMPNNLSFGLIKNNDFNKTISRTLNIQNISNSSKEYTVTLDKENNFEGIDIDFSPKLKVSSNSSSTFNINARINDNTKSGIYSGRLIFDDGSSKKIVPFIMLICPNDYPLISSFAPSQNLLSVNGDNKYENIDINYYIPDLADKVIIKAQKVGGESSSFVINEKENLKQGYITVNWNGKDVNNKALDDGIYFLKATAYLNGRTTDIDGNIIIIDKTCPEIKITETSIKDNTAHISGTVSDLMVKMGYAAYNLSKETNIDRKPVEIRAKSSSNDTWKDVELKDDGSFDFNIEKGKIYIEVEDFTGNLSHKEIDLN